MASIITIAGEKLFAAKAQANEQLDIDTFIFANVPSQDATAPINREEGIPTEHVVHQQIVQQVGRINDNVVVYSTVLDSITGPFEFNWVGLYSAINDTLVAINHVPTTPKTATAAGVAGNTLNRNFGIEYSGIADLTGIDVAPETWQLDFTARLQGMDKLTQQLTKDMVGKDSFIDDGFKVIPRSTANTFEMIPGAGYVNGFRVERDTVWYINMTPEQYPLYVYADAYFEGDASSTWAPRVITYLSTDPDKQDFIDGSGVQHYMAPLAIIKGDNDVEDLRVSFSHKDDSKTDNFSSVEKLKKNTVKYPDGKRVSTTSYYEGSNAESSPLNGSEYIVKSLSLLRIEFEDPEWVPDGFGDHLSDDGETVFMAVSDEYTLSTDTYGLKAGVPNTPALQAMNDKLTSSGGVIKLDREVFINSTLKLTRNVSVKGILKQRCGIVCDFNGWVGLGKYSVPENTGVFIEGGSDTDRGAKYGRQFEDMFVQGRNNSMMDTTGVYMGVDDRRKIASGTSISYAVRAAKISNFNVSQFDTGVILSEVWSSKVDMLETLACRRGLVVNGQSVNIKFSGVELNCAVFGNYTINKGLATNCLLIDNYTNYGPDENRVGRPEGLTFSLCNLYSANIGLLYKGALSVTFNQCIIDLHSDHAIVASSTAGLNINNSYIASSGGESMGATILLNPTGDADDLSCTLSGNHIYRIPTSSNANMKAMVATNRIGLNYIGNIHALYQRDVCVFEGVSKATIENNEYKLGADTGFTGQNCILLKGGDDVTVNGNKSFNSNKILKLSLTDKTTALEIGSNSSKIQRTSMKGELTLIAGATFGYVDLTNNNTSTGVNGETYLKSLVNYSSNIPGLIIGVKANGQNSNRCTFTLAEAQEENVVIQWTAVSY
jgi:hypothetical protein